MKKMIKVFYSLFSLPVLTITGFAQCSDAGVCRVGNFFNEESKKSFNFYVSYKNGYSGKDNDVTFNSFQLNSEYEIFSTSSVSLFIPYNFQSGPAGSVNGLGDIIISWNQELFTNETSSINGSIGIKLATGDVNKDSGLSQVYQAGLGSNDVIFTIDYIYKNFSIGAGYQLAGGRNEKSDLKLKRGDDFLARTSYFFPIDEFVITPQLLLIKRLSKSTILDLNSASEKFVEIDKSDQLQLNLLTKVQYFLNEDFSILAEAAIPFLKREVNVDGLKRAYSFSFGFQAALN